MAKEKTGAERSLRREFKGITVMRSPSGDFTFKISDLGSGANVNIIMESDAILTRQTPLEEQTGKQKIIQAALGQKAYHIGDRLPDSWVVGPTSPTTGIATAINPYTLKHNQTWHQGEELVTKLNKQGLKSARQPDEDELNAIFKQIVATGRNGNADLDRKAEYWSSKSYNICYAQTKNFSNGTIDTELKKSSCAKILIIRDEPDILAVP